MDFHRLNLPAWGGPAKAGWVPPGGPLVTFHGRDDFFIRKRISEALTTSPPGGVVRAQGPAAEPGSTFAPGKAAT